MIVRASGRLLSVALPMIVAAGCGFDTNLSLPPAISVSRTAVTLATNLAGNGASGVVTIVNGTEGTLEGLGVEVGYSAGQPSGWLSATLDRTTATRDQAATLTIEAQPGSLSLGSYDAVVKVSAANADNDNGLGFVEIRVTQEVRPRPPATIQIVTEPSAQVANGAVLVRQPVIQLLNAINEAALAPGVLVTAGIASGGGQLGGATSILTDDQGRAAFTDLAIVGPVGPHTLSFSADGLTGATSAVVSVTTGAAAAIAAVSATDQTAIAGSAVSAPPAVKIVDQSGNPVSGYPVTFGASSGSTIVPAGSVATNAGGVAALITWMLSPTAGANSVTATATGLPGSPVTFTATGTAGPPAQLAKQSGDNLIGLVGTTLGTPHVVKVTDGTGNPVQGVTVTWAAGGGGTVSPASNSTDGQGLAAATRTLGPNPGSETTTASISLGPVGLGVSFTVTAALAGPAQIVKIQGDNQTGTVGSTLAAPLTVQVLDAVGTPQTGVTVTFTTPNGGSFPSGAAVQTDGSGLASASWTLGVGSGSQTAQAAVGGPAPALFTATATPGPVSTVQVAANPATIMAGGSPSTITVTARDANANPVPGATVVLSLVGNGSVIQPTQPTDGAGQATGTFASTVAGANQLSATADGVGSAAPAGVTVRAAAPSAIVALTPTSFTGLRFGQSVAAGSRPAVKVVDAYNNPVPGATVTFGVISGASTLTPNATTTASDGTAVVSSWTISAVAGATLGTANVYNQVKASVSSTGLSRTFTGQAQVYHDADLQPIWTNYGNSGGTSGCISCHNGSQVPDLRASSNPWATLHLAPYATTTDTTQRSSTQNKLIYWPTAASGHTGDALSNNLLTIVAAWIAQGAPR